MKKYHVIISLILLQFSLVFLLNPIQDLRGAAIGTVPSQNITFILGFFIVFLSFILFVMAIQGGLEEEVVKNWKKYQFNKTSRYADLEQGYLRTVPYPKRKYLQRLIEYTVTGGKLIDEDAINKRRTYQEQFYEGHAGQGGRVIDVEGHIASSGKHKGKLIHFGQPANGRYLWIIDEFGNFILGNRQTMQHEMPQMKKEKIDYQHRLHKLPHATPAQGARVYGAGEVLIEGGLVKSFNSATGHYVDLKDITKFNHQGEEAFRYFLSKVGWKEISGGSIYERKH